MRKYLQIIGLGVVFSLMSACENGGRISRLEKQNQELQEKIKSDHVAAEYDLPG